MLRTTTTTVLLSTSMLAGACGDGYDAHDDSLATDFDDLGDDIAAGDFDDGGASPDDDEPPTSANGGHGFDTPETGEVPEPSGRILAWDTADDGSLLLQATASAEIEQLFATPIVYGLWLDLYTEVTYVAAIGDQGQVVASLAFAPGEATEVAGSHHPAAMWIPLDLPWGGNCYAPPCPWELDGLDGENGPMPDHMQMAVSPDGFETYGTVGGEPFGVSAKFDDAGVVTEVVNTQSAPLELEDYEHLSGRNEIMTDLQPVFAELVTRTDSGEIAAEDPCRIVDAAAWLSFAGDTNDCCIQWVGDLCVACPGPAIPEIGLGQSC